MSVDLSCSFCGLKLKNPVTLPALSRGQRGANDPDMCAEVSLRFARAGASMVSTPMIHAVPFEKYPKDLEPFYKWGVVKSEGFESLWLVSVEESLLCCIEPGVKMIKKLKEKLPSDVLVQANVMGFGADTKSWADLAKTCEEAGADIIELDLSCPHTAFVESPELASIKEVAGLPPSTIADTDLAAKIVKESTKACKVPVGYKMSPESGWPRMTYIAKACQEGGARFVSCTNAITGLPQIDIYNDGKMYYQYGGQTIGLTPGEQIPLVFYIGNANRFLGMRSVATIKTFVPQLDVVGISGITKSEYAVEYLMWGADIVSISSGFCFQGAEIARRTIRFLESFMEQKGFTSIGDIKNTARKRIVWDSHKVEWQLGRWVAATDLGKCNGCSRCATNICHASYMQAGKALVDEEVCNACGLCVFICPLGARYLIPRSKPRPAKELIGYKWKSIQT